MSFVNGLLLIDAPASALNNLGKIEGALTDNATGVKLIKTKEGAYPYVSAQAFRYWLRQTLEKGNSEWQAAPIYRETKIAYTDANPIKWWDDDLFGYMRAPSKKKNAAEAREADETRVGQTPTTETLTRVSPFRVSTLVSIAPVSIVDDFGVMSRHEGDPVPYEHQFYRTTLQGLFSLDLHAAGSFSYRNKTGFLNLDGQRIEEAKKAELEELKEEKIYRLPLEQRIKRIGTLFKGFASLEGGAKQTVHYTDVSPDLVIFTVTKGGNNIFGHIIGETKGKPRIKIEALKEALEVYQKDILSNIYIGWVKGYLDEEREIFEQALQEEGLLNSWQDRFVIKNPKEIFNELVQNLSIYPEWLK